MTVKEAIERIESDVLVDETRWIKGNNARSGPDLYTDGTMATSNDATCWCLQGAAIRVLANAEPNPLRFSDSDEECSALETALEPLNELVGAFLGIDKGDFGTMVEFNDNTHTTWDDIKKFLAWAKENAPDDEIELDY